MRNFFEKIWNAILSFIKKNSKEIIIPTLILFAICVAATILLGVTNFFTADIITAHEIETQNAAMQEVLPADDYVSLDDKDIYTALKNGAVAGYVFVTKANGYGGEIKVMTALDPTGKVAAISILSASDETPGLGQNVTKEDFYQRFYGMSKEVTAVKNGANESNNEINAWTGATISSKAVTSAVNEALKLYDEHFADDGNAKSIQQEGTGNEE